MSMLFKSAERNNNLDGRLGVDFYHQYKVYVLRAILLPEDEL